MEERISELSSNALDLDVTHIQVLFSYEPNDSLGLDRVCYTNSHPSPLSDSTDYLDLSSGNPSEDVIHMLDNIFVVQPQRKKRGRKLIRPNDPVRKKTEEKDKYWLRAFRAHIQHLTGELNREHSTFWELYLSPDGKPGKGHKFRSYGKEYKSFLFSNQDFVKQFRDWFDECGETLLGKKYEPGSDNWFVFYDYAARELYSYDSPGADARGPCSPLISHQNIGSLPSDEFLLDDIDMDLDPTL